MIRNVFRSRRRVLPLLIILVAVTLILLFLAVPRTSASACSASGPTSHAYAVKVCFTSPAGDTTLAGADAVAASLQVTGSAPRVQQVVYSLDGGYLLTSHSSPYTFTLPTTLFLDGPHDLRAQATMDDGLVLPPAQIHLFFKNGGRAAAAAQFAPAAGAPPAAGGPVVVAATGGEASGTPDEALVTDLIAQWNPNLFLYVGDVADRGSAVEFYNWYAPATFFGRFRMITNPTMGSQESSAAGAESGYADYWNHPPHYYSYNNAGWHLISLDSTLSFNETSKGTAQYQWLAQDLGANSAACTLAYFHDPPYDVGAANPNGRLADLWALLADHGVDVVMAGEAHGYQRWVPLDRAGDPSRYGMTEFVVGTVGLAGQKFARTDSRLAAGEDSAPEASGALRLKLNPAGAMYAYVDTEGNTLDSGVVPCGHAPDDTTPPSVPAGLEAVAVSSNQVDLRWDEAADNTGVAGYTIYRDGVALATVQGSEQSYEDKNVVSLTTYTYQVDAFDPAENHSGLSHKVTLKTPGVFTFTFTPTADAYVSEASPSMNYGTAKILRADSSPAVRSFLHFEVAGLVGSVAKATLRLYAESSASNGFSVAAVASGDWNERTIDYANAPGLVAGVPGASGSLAAGQWNELDVTALVKGNGPVDLAVVATGNTALRFASRESGAGAPQLIVESGTLPGAPGLDATAGSGPVPTLAATASPTATATPTGTVVSSIPVADTYVTEENPLGNYGAAKALRIDESPQVHTYLRFNVVSLKGRVIHATLRVFANSSSKLGFQVHAAADTTWAENALNWTNAPAITAVSAASSGPLTAGAWVEVDVSSLIAGNGQYSFALIGVGPTAINLASRESGPNSPQLVIQTNP